MSSFGNRSIPAIIVLAALSACAPLGVAPAPTLRYQCDGGREFSLSIAASGDSATIEIFRMKFALRAEPAAGPGQHYSCDVIALWRDGDQARVEMDGAPQFANCRLIP